MFRIFSKERQCKGPRAITILHRHSWQLERLQKSSHRDGASNFSKVILKEVADLSSRRSE